MTPTQSQRGSADGIEARRGHWLVSLTLKERVALMSGVDNWHTAPVERLGIPWLTMTDGPHGVRTQRDTNRIEGPATAFPTGSSRN